MFINSASNIQQFPTLKQSLLTKYTSPSIIVQESLMIIQQNDLLEAIKSKFQRKAAYDSFNNLALSSNSFNSFNGFQDQSCRNRFSEEFENSVLDSAIKQVKKLCSQQTYETIVNYALNNKSKEYDQIKHECEKKIKEIEQLSSLLIIKQKEICFLERDLSGVKIKQNQVEQEKKKIKKKSQILDQKQKRLHNIQMSLVFKEKLSLQAKRRYERQRQFNQSNKMQLTKIHNELELMWAKIVQKMGQSIYSCQGNCWKQQVLKKCKQQLFQQRKLLQEESKLIESQYDLMKNMSQQIKKVFILPGQGSKRND